MYNVCLHALVFRLCGVSRVAAREHAAKQLHLETNPSKKIKDESRRSAGKRCAAQSRISLQDPFMKCVLPRFMDGGIILHKIRMFSKKYVIQALGKKNQRLGSGWRGRSFQPLAMEMAAEWRELQKKKVPDGRYQKDAYVIRS